MKKITSLMLLAGVVILLMTQCKKKEDPQPDPIKKYTVDYKFQITGDYTSLKIQYFEAGTIKKEVSSPVVPWQMVYTDFTSGDSVSMLVTFVVPPGDYSYNWTWEIEATGNGILLEYGNNQQFTGNTFAPKPIEIVTWSGKLP